MRSDALGFFWEDRPVIKQTKVITKRTPPSRTWEDPSYLPHIEEARAFNVPLYTEVDLLNAHAAKEVLIFDVESYPNYFCICFRGLVSKRILYFEIRNAGQSLPEFQIKKLEWLLTEFCTVGFNSNEYDLTIATLAVQGCTAAQLKHATSMIIEMDMRSDEVLKEYRAKRLKRIDHIDLMEVAPLRASLKLYGGRLHTRRMQDLPFNPNATLSPDQQLVTLWYCINDLDQTIDLTNGLEEELTLRVQLSKEYGIDLRSKSDAQIAEALIGQGIRKLSGRYPQRSHVEEGTIYYYRAPGFLRYQTDLMRWVLARFTQTPLVVGYDGKIMTPEGFNDFVIDIAGKKYKLGIGGLHSQEESVSYFSSSTHTLREVDVTSFYPFIIILLQIYPSHLGTDFLHIFEQIVHRRLDAKRKKFKSIADSLKIVINGTFGKLGSEYSIFYEPDLLVKVTFTGQLTLLMLIEAFELMGIPVVSANTDGILTLCPNEKLGLMDQLVKDWEHRTGFMMEDTTYRSVHKRDVNNYIAVKIDGKEPTVKGIFKKPGLQKNPANRICYKAVEAFVCDGTPIEKTIRECQDVRSFVTVRTVKGGAVKDGVYIGKAIRWYYATGVEGEIIYASSGNKVPRSDGARPLLDLPTSVPADVNYDWYIGEALELLKQVNYPGSNDPPP